MIAKRNGVLAISLLVIALPAAAGPVTVRARADQVRTMRVSYADLNINSDAGLRQLMQRVKGAAEWVCDVSTYMHVPLDEQMAGRTCYDASLARARSDISAIQQRAQNGLSARGEIEVAQR
ncbi:MULTISPECIES: UrcA family protein [Sphingomonas]|uniref:UrcA family protein n=1 Tax=Sphingomonas lycopersici TaxID=2951807 RepID=A0AA42CUH3_9SPHN|nr:MULTISPECIES: UrcA family protein [Sphingomonas]MCW6532825.1 UrcA family protein [Sphingomonas lycopersici]MCW6535458.1 UrcA family protein [Sphingomonas lycopersici]